MSGSETVISLPFYQFILLIIAIVTASRGVMKYMHKQTQTICKTLSDINSDIATLKTNKENLEKNLDETKHRVGTIEKVLIPAGIKNMPAVLKALSSAENAENTVEEENQ
jgi:vacuolar-type H+-ATPase subunit D/Vma8